MLSEEQEVAQGQRWLEQAQTAQSTGRAEEGVSAYQEALAVYRRLDQARPGAYTHAVAGILINMGALLQDLSAGAQAAAALAEAVDVNRRLVLVDPMSYEPYLAAALSNLGRVLRDLDKMEEAEGRLQEAVLIYRRLTSAQPGQAPNLALTLDSLGTVLQSLDRLPDADDAYREAVAILFALSQQRPGAYEPNLARILVKRGALLRGLERLEDSAAAYSQALEIGRRLAQAQPEAYAPAIASNLIDLASVLRDLHKLDEARDVLLEGATLYRRLARAQPDVYEPRLTGTLIDLAGTLRGIDQHEEAERAYREALEIARRLTEGDPETLEPALAATLRDLGRALWEQEKNDEAQETLEEALAIYRRLAQARPETYEHLVADTLNTLGAVLQRLRKLEQSEEISRQAVGAYRRLAQIRPGLYEPELAKSLTVLATGLEALRRFEEAEGTLREALAIQRRLAKAEPEKNERGVAMILDGLGALLWRLGRMNETEEAFREAIGILEPLARARPDSSEARAVAELVSNLGVVLQDLGRLEESEGALREALGIRRHFAEARPEAFESTVASDLRNLGTVLRDRGKREDAEHAFRESLDIYRRLARAKPEGYEPDVAMALTNLGWLLTELRRPADAEQALRESAELMRTHDRPDLGRLALANLGRFLAEQERWDEAEAPLRGAVEQIERLRSEILTLDRRQSLLRENVGTYERLVVCLMKLGRHADALEIAERGKSRTLVDLLSLRDLRPRNAPEEVTRAYEQMLFRARALEDELRRGEDSTAPGEPGRERGTVRQELAEATGRIRELAQEIGSLDPDFLPHTAPLTQNDMLDLARDAASTLVLFRVTQAGSFTFLVWPDGLIEVVEVPDFTTASLTEILSGTELTKENVERILRRLTEDVPIDGWVTRYYAYQTLVGKDPERAAIAHGHWLAGMEQALGELYQSLLKPVHDALRARDAKDVVFMPNRGLAILPLHACWWEENGSRRYLLDEFNIRYAPSLSVFARCLERERLGRDGDTMLTIANPEPPGDLAFAEWECDEIETLIGHAQCLTLRGKDALRAEVSRWADSQHWLHFSCHGQYRLDAPLDSPLHLAGGERLTMGDIFEHLYLPQTWLVSLSACETGLVDFRDVADEHYGLPTAFLYAGVPTVFASLWMVNDLSTALVMTKAYDGIVTDKKDKADALRDAQLWVRDLTAADIVDLLLGQGSQLAPVRRHYEDAYDATDRPFAHPYWWAAFQCVGA